LIECNSISSVNPALDQGNRTVIELLANWLDALGFKVEIMPLADPRKANLIATLGTGPGGLVLSGHADTVPCNEELWQQDPFVLQEKMGKLYGLGVCDMKGFFPIAIEAARAFLDKPLKQPLIILATADEESSMSGAQALVRAGRPKARYAVIGEPTGMRPITMHKGILLEKLSITGSSGHSSNPALGRNAMESMHKAISTLLNYRAELQQHYQNPLFDVNVPTMNLGCIHGGDNPNRICGSCELSFEIRPLPGMALAEIQGELMKRLTPIEAEDQVTVSLEHMGVPPFAAATDSELTRLCEKLTGHAGQAVNFATEAPYLQELGMDVLVMGPGSIDQAHQPNEYLDTAAIRPAVDFLVQLIGRCCL
jgi:acetylornithine deacetylase